MKTPLQHLILDLLPLFTMMASQKFLGPPQVLKVQTVRPVKLYLL
jgi:hypothetical protein